jgi:parallel beta helix pectate lyase-like protein
MRYRRLRRARVVGAVGALLVGLVGASAAPASAHGSRGDVYVSEHGHNGPGCGTKSEPCRTITHGIGNAPAGWTVHVGPGTYPEQVVLTRQLRLLGDSATIDATGKTNGIVIGPGASGSIVDGFLVENAIGEGILATQVKYVRIAHNTVTKNDTGATAKSTTYPPCLPQGEVPGDCGEGLHLQGTSYSQVIGNHVVHNVGGILVSDDVAPAHDNVIAYNTASDNALDCGITLPSHAPGTGVYDNIVEWNTVTNNGGAGVLFAAAAPGTGSHDNVARHNYIAGNGEGGVAIHAHTPMQNVDNNKVVQNVIGTNTITGDPDAGVTQTTGVIVFSAVVPVKGTIVRNNVIADNAIGIWLSKNVDKTFIYNNLLRNVTTGLFQ